MGASSGGESLSPREANWDAIFAEVNAWRGACVHHFSKVEAAVTETLLALGDVSPGGGAVRLRHLIGQRFEDLAAAIAPDGPFGEAGKTMLGALARYREEHEAFRRVLCHGVVKVTVDRNGQWVVVIRVLSIRARQAEREVIALDKGEAEARLATLKQDGQKLASALGQLRRSATPD